MTFSLRFSPSTSFFLFTLSALLAISCGGSSSPTVAAAACASVPSGATVNGTNYNASTGHCTTETSGKWTALTVHIPNSGSVSLNATCDDVAPFADQTTFDASEGGAGITSNADYVVTSTCASGSTHNSTTKELFIWKKNP